MTAKRKVSQRKPVGLAFRTAALAGSLVGRDFSQTCLRKYRTKLIGQVTRFALGLHYGECAQVDRLQIADRRGKRDQMIVEVGWKWNVELLSRLGSEEREIEADVFEFTEVGIKGQASGCLPSSRFS
jgi:hypothetical protein